ncbi:MAG: type II secretion system protein [Brachyspira sp.]|nr:type II secretion system protein [Brachyspira sp.]
MTKHAFTLAEVLITLGIIGIVAAMTLPSLVNKAKYKELETALHKNYSILQQALQRAQLDTGEVVSPSNYQNIRGNGRAPFKDLLIKYIINAKDCGVGSDQNSCVENGELTGNENATKFYRNYNNKNDISYYYLDDGQFITTDGTLFLIENSATDNTTIVPIYITVDVNGLNKKPNRWGHDLFTFQLMNNGKLLPMGAEGTYFEPEQYCSATNSGKLNGIACTYRALTDKNYWKEL